jgi:hypothetical protein
MSREFIVQVNFKNKDNLDKVKRLANKYSDGNLSKYIVDSIFPKEEALTLDKLISELKSSGSYITELIEEIAERSAQTVFNRNSSGY